MGEYILVTLKEETSDFAKMSLLIRSVLAVLLCITLRDASALKCEDDMSKWFLANGEWTGDFVEKPNNQRLIVERNLKVFGETFSGYKVRIRKGRATGEIRFYPMAGFRQPGAFTIRASRLNYDYSYLGNVKVRMTTRPDDIDEIEQILNQAHPCLTSGNFRPNHAVVATYTCMLHNNERSTFQVVVAGNSERTFVILQYHQLHGQHTIQFGFMERLTRKKFKFTGRRRDSAEELLKSTNGIRPGVWVFDVTDNEPRKPELCPKEDNECTVTDYGLVHSYDGITQVLPPEFLTVLSSTQLDYGDICNFESRMRMEVHGQVKFVEFFYGAITNANPEDRFHFTFDRKEGKAYKRGPNLRTAQVLNSYPHYEQDGDNRIVIRKTNQGWKLISDFCDYDMVFRPDEREPVYTMRSGARYAGLLDGYCENFDGIASNDEDLDF